DLLLMSVPQPPTRHRVFTRLPQAGRLRFAAAFRYCFSKIGKEDSEPEPDRQLSHKAAQFQLRRENSDSRYGGADHGHKHDRVLQHETRVQLFERVPDSRTNNVPVKERCRFLRHRAQLRRNVRVSLTPGFIHVDSAPNELSAVSTAFLSAENR